jgi:hypothetical protein
MAVTVFLKLTDYVDSSELCELAPETLQSIVCGEDGLRLERIRQSSGAKETRFISAPFPGFYVKSGSESASGKAVTQLEALMGEINQAAAVKNATSSTCRRGAMKRELKKTNSRLSSSRAKSSFKNAFYHPLYSANQYHLMPGLLPTPQAMSTGCCSTEQSSSPQPLSDEDCERILSSPYLCAWKRRNSPHQSDVQEELPSMPTTSSFDKELEGCLPGVPGIRQSKEYKKIRRKISEIDELTKSGASLDACQRAKIEKRPEYVSQLRHMLLHGLETAHEEKCLNCADDSEHSNECLPPIVEPVNEPPTIFAPEVPPKQTKRKTKNKVILKVAPRDPIVIPKPVSAPGTCPPQSGILLLLVTMLRGIVAILRSSVSLWIDAWSDFFIGIDPPPLRSTTINVVVNSISKPA